jgi:hypothetical protein
MKTAYLNITKNSRGNFHGRSDWEDARDAAWNIESKVAAVTGISWWPDSEDFGEDFGKYIVLLLKNEIEKLPKHLQKMITIEILNLEDE